MGTNKIRSNLKRVRDSGLVSKRILGRHGAQLHNQMPNCDQNGKASDPSLDGRSLCPGHASRTYRANGREIVYLPYPHPREYFHDTARRAALNLYGAEEIWEDALRRAPITDAWCDACQCRWIEFIYSKIQDHEEITKRIHAKREALANKGQYTKRDTLGPREFTLTYSPDKHYSSDTDAQEAMRQAIDRLTRYYRDEIIEFHAVGEYTDAGRAHVHGWYHLSGGRKITDKNFRRAYPPWNPKRKLGRGHEGGHHQTIERVSDFHGYTEKHLEEAWLYVNINASDNSRSPSPARILEGEQRSDEEDASVNSSREDAGPEDPESNRNDRQARRRP